MRSFDNHLHEGNPTIIIGLNRLKQEIETTDADSTVYGEAE
ncbi:hypothetical protein J2S17_003568 [Cytobacillus purgationiresistens]|uniref:Uncharacterized protein n=1 Tax=Cytobacillus purgationiresistens TaxID=863449 RepID=A0ABU0AKW4_9BACI|nr:hypothetical protein [Cytobacillus purgationiresistens]